ncbi:MAG: type II toxin-antitoxin system HipA family toxin, partial [Gemmatimonadota bacterium]
MNYAVYYGRVPLGDLFSARARLRFTYRAEVVKDGGPALSVRLPARDAAYTHDDASPYFSNLLPEDEYRRLLARMLGLSDRNVAGLLGAIGGECAGAVSIWPAGQQPAVVPDYVPLADEDVRRLFESPDASERMDIVREGRLSLAGGMEKLGLRRREERWYRGRGGAPTTHILKWSPARFPDLTCNELLCLKLCEAAGFAMPAARIEAPGTPVLIVERFDRRVAADGEVAVIHQEDFCQALGVEPAQKYQTEGGPGFAACAKIIRDHCAVPARDLGQLLRWAVANYLVGNGDAHGKNLSLLHDADGVRLAPIYDVGSTLVYGGLSRKLAMSVGGEYRFDFVRARHWERLAEDLGLPFDLVRRNALSLALTFEALLS